MAEIEVEGLKELDRALAEFPLKLQRRILNKAMAAGARIIANEVKARAPVKTGAIKRNVGYKRGDRRYNEPGMAGRHIVGVQHGKVRSKPSVIRLPSGRRKIAKLTKYDLRGQDPFYFRFVEKGYHAVGRLPKQKGVNARAARRQRVAAARFVPGQRFMQQGFNASAGRAVEKVRQVLAAEIEKLT